jgi:integrase
MQPPVTPHLDTTSRDEHLGTAEVALRSTVTAPSEHGGAGEAAEYGAVDFTLPASASARIERAVPANTRRAYTSRWRSFTAWCSQTGRVAMPATEQTVAAYLDHLAGVRGLAATTLDAHLAAIRVRHRAEGHVPPEGLYARKIVVDRAHEQAAEAHRAHGPRRALPLDVAGLTAIVEHCDTTTAAGLRTRAVVLLGFALLARRSELAALNLADARLVRGRGLAVTIRTSKTDQHATGTVRHIAYASDPSLCPVRAMITWRDYLANAGIRSGPLFVRIDRWGNLGAQAGGHYTAGERDGRLRSQAIGDLITAAATACDLTPILPEDLDATPDPAENQYPETPDADPEADAGGPPKSGRGYTGHSLRRGGTTAMLANGANPLRVSRHGRWIDGSRAFAAYVEEVHGFDSENPTQGLL